MLDAGERLEALRHEVWGLAETITTDELAAETHAMLGGTFDRRPDPRRIALLGVQPKLVATTRPSPRSWSACGRSGSAKAGRKKDETISSGAA